MIQLKEKYEYELDKLRRWKIEALIVELVLVGSWVWFFYWILSHAC